MIMSSIITGLMSNSVLYNKKRPVDDNLVKDVKPDKRLKGHKSDVKNDDCKDQSLDDIPKQINVPIKKSVVSYSTISDRNMKLSQFILDNNVSKKIDSNITVSYISSILESMSKVKVKDTLVEDPNILKVSFVHRVKELKLQSDIVLYYIVLYVIMLCCVLLYCIVLCCVVLC